MTETHQDAADHSGPDFFKLDKARTGSEHPERHEGEIFLGYGNSWTLDVAYAGYASRRTGEVVVDDFGRDRTEDAKRVGGLYPIFASEVEHGEKQP